MHDLSMKIVLCVLPAIVLTGCLGKREKTPDLGAIYDVPAQNIGDARVPVVVIPGILGSKLDDESGVKVWGSFTFGAADADTAEGARLIALPMEVGVPLDALRDNVRPVDVLDVIQVDIGLLRGIELGAYVDIMRTLAAGKYRDQSLGRSGAIDYGGMHYTCFQVPYDWRRDISEQAAALEAMILEAQDINREALGLNEDEPLKVDVIAHSMGGLVLRYYLRYGTQELPDDGSLPEVTWEGAQNVRQAILIGTPNSGAVNALSQLIDGLNLNPLFPNYRPALLGTMPAIYQLLPRSRHMTVIDQETDEALDIFDIGVWERYGWGLADPDEDKTLRKLLPEVETAEERRAIAMDHLEKCLARADQLHRALDRPALPPDGTTISLFAGDAERTPMVLSVANTGKVRVHESVAGDGTVTRASALMDERAGGEWEPHLQSPVEWDRVQFIFADHLELTRDPSFVDNILFMLLETPRE